MKKILKAGLILFLSMIIVAELFALAASAEDSGMSLVYQDAEKQWYVNTLTLVSPAPGLVSFWNRIVPAKGSEFYSHMGAMLKEAGINPRKLEYVQALMEMDCSSDKSTVWSVLYYDRKDRIVRVSSQNRTAQDSIKHEQAQQSVRRTVCASTIGRDSVKRNILAQSDDSLTTVFLKRD